VARHIFKPARCGYTLSVTSHKDYIVSLGIYTIQPSKFRA
jgi:hypothetical protein